MVGAGRNGNAFRNRAVDRPLAVPGLFKLPGDTAQGPRTAAEYPARRAITRRSRRPLSCHARGPGPGQIAGRLEHAVLILTGILDRKRRFGFEVSQTSLISMNGELRNHDTGMTEFVMNRRTLLQAAAAFPLSIVAGRLYALPRCDAPRLLVVFLRGAYDAANIVVPVSSDFYYAARPNLAIREAAALPLDTDWALHPALKDSLYPLWQRKQIAFVPFAGTDDTSRCHFETQDTIELGPAGRGIAQLSLRLHEPHRAGAVGRHSDLLHQPAAADLSRGACRSPISRSISPASRAWRDAMPH